MLKFTSFVYIYTAEQLKSHTDPDFKKLAYACAHPGYIAWLCDLYHHYYYTSIADTCHKAASEANRLKRRGLRNHS
jgi:hypothetical protein